MGNVRFGIPRGLVERIRKIAGVRVAVETGTYLGESTRVLASLFEYVWTVESSPDYWKRARSRLNNVKVELVLGDSAECLGGILATLGEPAVFWLDSHWFPLTAITADPQCPLNDEISAIAAWPHAAKSWLLIDDVSLFRELPALPGYRPAEWPILVEMETLVRSEFPYHLHLS